MKSIDKAIKDTVRTFRRIRSDLYQYTDQELYIMVSGQMSPNTITNQASPDYYTSEQQEIMTYLSQIFSIKQTK